MLNIIATTLSIPPLKNIHSKHWHPVPVMMENNRETASQIHQIILENDATLWKTGDSFG